MPLRRSPLLVLAAGALLLPAAPAAAVTAHAPTDPVRGGSASTDLWASVNKCDTKAAPNTVGVRGSMPGLGQRSVAWMRFRVQFRRAVDGRWLDAGPAAATGWERLGTTTAKVLESGHDFRFVAPPAGGRHVLRGVVDFRWTRRDKVLRHASRLTTTGHPSSAGGDPAGYSAAVCTIR